MNPFELSVVPYHKHPEITLIQANSGKEKPYLSYVWDHSLSSWYISILVRTPRKGIGTMLVRKFASTVGPEQPFWGIIDHSESISFIRQTILPQIAPDTQTTISPEIFPSIPIIKFFAACGTHVDTVTLEYYPPGYWLEYMSESTLGKLSPAAFAAVSREDLIYACFFGHT